MEQKLSQKRRVLDRLESVGYVDNFWAIDNYILRLGDIIFRLRKEGLQFEGKFGKELGKDRSLWKNFYYIKKRELKQGELF